MQHKILTQHTILLQHTILMQHTNLMRRRPAEHSSKNVPYLLLPLIVLIMLSTFMFFSPACIWAQAEAGAVSIFPLIGGYVFEKEQNLDNKPAFGIGVGYNPTHRWGLEASFIGLSTKSGITSEDVNAYLYRLEGLFHFDVADRFIPFLAAGPGGITLSPETGVEKSDGLFNYGGGFKLYLTGDVALRADIRHVMTFGSPARHNNMLYTAGLSISFGGGRRNAPQPPPDWDYIPEPAPLSRFTEPLDSDGDGVPDDRDECPGTPAGARVDYRGCWSLGAILFDFDKSVIRPAARPILDEVVVVLQNNPGVRIDIEGHTDSTGPARYNQGLSERRAKSVMEYFISSGVAPLRLTAHGFGETRQFADNNTREGRALNRRDELKPVQ